MFTYEVPYMVSIPYRKVRNQEMKECNYEFMFQSLIGRFVTELSSMKRTINPFQSLIGRFVTHCDGRDKGSNMFQSLIGRFVTVNTSCNYYVGNFNMFAGITQERVFKIRNPLQTQQNIFFGFGVDLVKNSIFREQFFVWSSRQNFHHMKCLA